MNDSANILAACDGTAPPGRQTSCINIWGLYSSGERAERFLGCTSKIRHSGWAVDPSLDRTLSVLNCSVAEDVIRSGTADDSADILARCASTSLAGGLRASMSG